MNIWDVTIAGLIALAVVLALRSMWRARREGGCASCPYAGSCGKASRGAGSKGCEANHG